MEKSLILLLQPTVKEHIDPFQLAYKYKRSNLDIVVVLHYIIMFILEKSKECVWCGFLCYSSAFLSIPRQLFLNKLISVNTASWTTKWLIFYPYGKGLYAAFGGKCSASPLSHEDVPQRTVIFLLLLPFFLHDLLYSTKTLLWNIRKISLYEYRFLPLHIPLKWMSSCLVLSGGLSVNGLILTPSRCQAVNFSLRHK